MITSSGRSGGGSNRDVVFTLKVVTDPKAKQQFDSMNKAIDEARRKMAAPLGGPGSGAAGAAGAGGKRGGMTDLDRELKDLDRRVDLFNRAQDLRIRNQERARDEAIKKSKEFRSHVNNIAEGLTGLTRAWVLMGATGEESLEKLVRKLAVFEGAVAGFKGAQKITAGISGMTGLSMPAVAGIGVGIAGAGVAGLALMEQYRGKAGPIANWTARSYSGAYRWAMENGFGWTGDPEQDLAMQGRSRLMKPYTDLASSQIRGERMFGRAFDMRSNELMGNQSELDRAISGYRQTQRLHAGFSQLLSGATSEREAAAASYFSMDPRQRAMAKMSRDRFFKDPKSVNEQELFGISPLVDKFSQSKIREELTRRAGEQGVFGGEGWRKNTSELTAGAIGKAMAEIKLPQQREIVVKLSERNSEIMKAFEDLLKRVAEEAEEKSKAQMEEVANRILGSQRQLNSRIDGILHAESYSYGAY